MTFGTPVENLFKALLSIGRTNVTVTYDFDQSFTVDCNGVGFWSSGIPGTYSLGAGDSIGMNEFHTVLLFNGPITSLTYCNFAGRVLAWLYVWY